MNFSRNEATKSGLITCSGDCELIKTSHHIQWLCVSIETSFLIWSHIYPFNKVSKIFLVRLQSWWKSSSVCLGRGKKILLFVQVSGESRSSLFAFHHFTRTLRLLSLEPFKLSFPQGFLSNKIFVGSPRPTNSTPRPVISPRQRTHLYLGRQWYWRQSRVIGKCE